jgi:hypothetical protein
LAERLAQGAAGITQLPGVTSFAKKFSLQNQLLGCFSVQEQGSGVVVLARKETRDGFAISRSRLLFTRALRAIAA